MLRLLLDGQPRTRAELIDLSGLARSTVTGRIEELVAAGLVVPSGEAASTGGRPPARFRFNPAARLILAADVGATHLSVALTNLTGEILDRSTMSLNIAEGPEEVLSAVVRTGRALLKKARRSVNDLAGTGVGLGLAVARGFADAVGGSLHAEDTPGGGLTMVLSLPAAGGGAPELADVPAGVAT